jgi:hypothetical protein
MSADLRPTVTAWGPHTSRFLDEDTIEEFMHWLAKQAGVDLETEDRKDGTDYVFLDGMPVLIFLTRCHPKRPQPSPEHETARAWVGTLPRSPRRHPHPLRGLRAALGPLP